MLNDLQTATFTKLIFNSDFNFIHFRGVVGYAFIPPLATRPPGQNPGNDACKGKVIMVTHPAE